MIAKRSLLTPPLVHETHIYKIICEHIIYLNFISPVIVLTMILRLSAAKAREELTMYSVRLIAKCNA